MACSVCGSESVIFMPYSGRELCRRHFLRLARKRFRRELRKQVALRGRVAAAVSGGKDSVVLLHLLSEIISPMRQVELVAVAVDEGIEGYRKHSLAYAQKAADDCSVAFHEVSFQDLFGKSLDAMLREGTGRPCTVCGVLRRRALNRTARELGARWLFTGHNLDDYAQTVLMNLLSGEPHRLARVAPHTHVHEGQVPRAVPLRTTPEKECTLIAILEGWSYYDGECPYAAKAGRRNALATIYQLEDSRPGTRHGLVRTMDRLAPYFRNESEPPNRCRLCGELSTREICMACTVLSGLDTG